MEHRQHGGRPGGRAGLSEGRTIQLETTLSDTGAGVWTSQQFRLNTAHAKILTLLLAFNQPIDLLSGQKIDIAKALHYSNSKEFHHFFPRDYLVGQRCEKRKANLLAAFVMLTANSNKRITNRATADYLREVEGALGERLKTALESNLISDAAYAAALADDYDTFLNERAQTIWNAPKS